MRAAEVWKSVYQLNPDHPSAHYRRSMCLKALGGRDEEAIAELRSAD